MNQRRRNQSNQDKSKKNCKIIRCSFLSRPVFENDTCQGFVKNINKEADNNCRNCKYSFWYNTNCHKNFLKRVKLKYERNS